MKTGKCLATFSGHHGSVLCLKFDKNWDMDPANALRDMNGVSNPSFSMWRRGFMVSGSSDTSVCVWDIYSRPIDVGDGTVDIAVTGAVRGILKGHSLGVLDIRIDKQWIISW